MKTICFIQSERAWDTALRPTRARACCEEIRYRSERRRQENDSRNPVPPAPTCLRNLKKSGTDLAVSVFLIPEIKCRHIVNWTVFLCIHDALSSNADRLCDHPWAMHLVTRVFFVFLFVYLSYYFTLILPLVLFLFILFFSSFLFLSLPLFSLFLFFPSPP